jgi:HEAT repeat protein
MVLLAALVALAAVPAGAQQFPPATAEAEAKLIAVLKSDDASREDKATACRRLAVIGTPKAIPVLAGLLGDEDMSHMARYALEPMDDPAAGAALRKAVKQVKGRPLVGIIGSLGVRKDAKAVPLVAPLLESSDADVAHAAARALGSIGTPDAVAALREAIDAKKVRDTQRLALAEGLLRAAERMDEAGKRSDAVAVYDHLRGLDDPPHQVRTAAVRGAILARGKDGLALLKETLASDDYLLFAAACRTSHEMDGKDVTRALADALGRGAADRKILVLLTLGRRQDPAAADAVMAVAKDAGADKAVRLQAITAAGEINDPAAADALVDLASDEEEEIAKAARESLASIPGEQVDAAVMKLFTSQDTNVRLVAMHLIGRRRMRDAVPALLKAARADDTNVRATAIRQLGELAGPDRLSVLLDLLMGGTESQVLGAAQGAVLSVCSRAENPETCAGPVADLLPKGDPRQKVVLLRILGGIGGETALKAVRGAVGSDDQNVHTTAIRTLADWKTPDVLPALVAIAKQSDNPRDRTLALRGYLGWASRRGRDQLPRGKRLDLCRTAAGLVKTAGQKKALLGALGRIRSPEAIDLILPHLDDAEVRTEAAAAAVAVAEELLKVGGGKRYAKDLVAPLEKVADAAEGDLAKRAKGLLNRARSKAK